MSLASSLIAGLHHESPTIHRTLIRKPEMHDVAVGDDVVLAFEPELAGSTRARFAIERDIVAAIA
jgi:hypothetical protein